MNTKNSTSSGNVLFLILIAVALFAALSYAVTQSSRTGGSNVSREQADLIATTLTQHGTAIETTIQRLKLSGNCTDQQISFDNSIVPFGNGNSPLDRHCHIFDPAGGGVSYLAAQSTWVDSTKTATLNAVQSGWGNGYMFPNAFNLVPNIGTDGNGAASADLIIQFINLRQDVCEAINRRLSFNGPSYTAPSSGIYLATAFTGTFTAGTTMSGDYNGAGGGCIYTSQYGGFYTYVKVVMPR